MNLHRQMSKRLQATRPRQPQHGKLLNETATTSRVAPVCPHPVAPQQAVLVLGETGQGHAEDSLLGPARLGRDGEHLGG